MEQKKSRTTTNDACDGSRHSGPCSGGQWDKCNIPKGPRGYAKRLRDGNMAYEDCEYRASLLESKKPILSEKDGAKLRTAISELAQEAAQKMSANLTPVIGTFTRNLEWRLLLEDGTDAHCRPDQINAYPLVGSSATRVRKIATDRAALLTASIRLLENLEENGRGRGNPEADSLRAAIIKAQEAR